MFNDLCIYRQNVLLQMLRAVLRCSRGPSDAYIGVGIVWHSLPAHNPPNRTVYIPYTQCAYTLCDVLANVQTRVNARRLSIAALVTRLSISGMRMSVYAAFTYMREYTCMYIYIWSLYAHLLLHAEQNLTYPRVIMQMRANFEIVMALAHTPH